MSLKPYLLAGLLLCLQPAFAQRDSSRTLADVANMAVCLYGGVQNGAQFGGAAVLINHAGKEFIVTAAHIAKNVTLAVLKVDGRMPIVVAVNDLSKTGKGNWEYHPVADLALLEIMPINEEVKARVANFSLPSSFIYRAKEAPDTETALLYFGFTFYKYLPPTIDYNLQGEATGFGTTRTKQPPPIFFDTQFNFKPEIFTAHVIQSEIVEKKRNDIDQKSLMFYFDSPHAIGSEGSGVFQSVKKITGTSTGKTQLIGIVHGTPTNKKLPQFAAVTPSFYIWDFLDQYK